MSDLSPLTQETEVMFDGDPLKHGTHRLALALPVAVRTIMDIMTGSDSEALRLRAATFVVNTVLPKNVNVNGDSSPLAALLGAVVVSTSQVSDSEGQGSVEVEDGLPVNPKAEAESQGLDIEGPPR